jgi:hypothetical protein
MQGELVKDAPSLVVTHQQQQGVLHCFQECQRPYIVR